MPRVKKATISKPVKKVAKSATKSTQDESSILHQTLVGSLVKLDKYWNKQLTSTKKQLDTQKVQLKKAQDKLKDLKIKRAEKASISKSKGNPTSAKQLEKATIAFQSQQDKVQEIKSLISQSREKIQVAKLTLKKYVTLNKTVETSEKDWLKQIKEATAATKKTKPTPSKTAPKSTATKKKPAKKEESTPAEVKAEKKSKATKAVKQKSATTAKPRRGRKAKAVMIDTSSEQELDNNAQNLAELNTEISEAMNVDISEFDTIE